VDLIRDKSLRKLWIPVQHIELRWRYDPEVTVRDVWQGRSGPMLSSKPSMSARRHTVISHR
jgi:hypothetical protein